MYIDICTCCRDWQQQRETIDAPAGHPLTIYATDTFQRTANSRIRTHVYTYVLRPCKCNAMHAWNNNCERGACMHAPTAIALHCIDRSIWFRLCWSDQTKSQGIYMIDCSLCMSVSILLIFSLQNACIYIFIYAMHASTMHQCMHPK